MQTSIHYISLTCKWFVVNGLFLWCNFLCRSTTVSNETYSIFTINNSVFIYLFTQGLQALINSYTLTVAPSLIDIGFDFFPIWLLMLKPILETLWGAGGIPEESSSSSGVRCSDVRLTAVPSPPTVLQETGLVFTLPSSSCGPAWGKTTHQGEQQFPATWIIIKAIYNHLYLCDYSL